MGIYFELKLNLEEKKKTRGLPFFLFFFQVMNSMFYFSEKYMQCVEEHLPYIKPFGDDHEKLALILQRSMVAARTTIKAVKSAHEIATEMKMVSNK